jgi:hypothetical protein
VASRKDGSSILQGDRDHLRAEVRGQAQFVTQRPDENRTILETLDEHFYAPASSTTGATRVSVFGDPVLKRLYRTNALRLARRAASVASGAGAAR